MANEYARMGRVLTAYRGHFTRALNEVERTVAWADAQPVASSRCVTNITNAIEALERRFRLVEDMTDQVIALPDGPNNEVAVQLTTRVTETATLLGEQQEMAATALARHEAAQIIPAPAAAPIIGDGAADPPRTIRPNTALKPDKLSRDNTPVEYRVWRNAFNAYYTSSRMDASDLVTQRAYLYASLDSPLAAALEALVQVGTPVYGAAAPGVDGAFEPSCMSMLDDIFTLAYPLHSRRLAVFRYQPTSGQSFIAWYNQLRLLGDEADLEALGVDSLYVMFCLVASTYLPKLREKFMELHEKTLPNILQTARNFESAQKDIKASDKTYNNQSGNKSNSTTAKANAAQTSKGKQTPGGAKPKGNSGSSGTNEKLRDDLRRRNLCFRCGLDREHRPNGVCTAKDKQCTKCKTVGHIAKTCLQVGAKSYATVAAANTNASTSGVVAPGNGVIVKENLGPANLALGRTAALKSAAADTSGKAASTAKTTSGSGKKSGQCPSRN